MGVFFKTGSIGFLNYPAGYFCETSSKSMENQTDTQRQLALELGAYDDNLHVVDGFPISV